MDPNRIDTDILRECVPTYYEFDSWVRITTSENIILAYYRILSKACMGAVSVTEEKKIYLTKEEYLSKRRDIKLNKILNG